jgi:predicted transcriptional regulator YdeE
MKATIEIPDELYRQVKAKSALEGRAIREVTIDLYQTWVTQNQPEEPSLSPEQWVEEWLRLGQETLRNAQPGPTAREILEEDRNRLERH